MFHRERPEKEYEYVSLLVPARCLLLTLSASPLYKKYGLGTTTWSSLAGGLLTGKVRAFYHTYISIQDLHIDFVASL